jgi:hypothetical protein
MGDFAADRQCVTHHACDCILAERDALRDAYNGVVIQMRAVLTAVDEGVARFPVSLKHLAGMAQAMRNYIEVDREELARAASVSKEEARDGD